MPRLPSDLGPGEPGEIVDYPIDFGPLRTGVTISSAAWHLTVRYVAPSFALDPAPQSRVSGSATVAASVTTQRIAGLQPGNTYLVTATATMSDGEVIILWCALPCVPPA